MNKLLLVTAATAASLSTLLFIKPAQAASFSVTVTENYTDASTPAPGVPGLFLYNNLVSATGEITSIDGFSSFEGVEPNSLTFNFGNLVLLSYSNEDGIIYSEFGSNGATIPYFNLFQNGNPIATSNNISATGTLNPSTEAGTQIVKFTLNGVIGNPFYNEILTLTNGTGILELRLNSDDLISSGNLNSATFFYDGGTLLASPPSETIPEPITILGSVAAVGLGALFKKHQGKKIEK